MTGIIVKVKGRLLCLTLPAVSGVKSFLCSSVKDCGPPLQKGTKERKRAKNSNKKRNYLDKTTFFFAFL